MSSSLMFIEGTLKKKQLQQKRFFFSIYMNETEKQIRCGVDASTLSWGGRIWILYLLRDSGDLI